MIPVNTAPINTPMIGLLNAVSTFVNSGIFARGDMESLIMPIPCIRRAKPIRTVPKFFFFCDLHAIIINAPTNAIIGEKLAGFNNDMKKLSVCMLFSESSQDVAVLPTFAPNITKIVCESVMIPEFTSPTSITVSADDDCSATVIATPKNKLMYTFEVSFLRLVSSFPPATFSRLPESTFIPKRKNASPPNSENTE